MTVSIAIVALALLLILFFVGMPVAYAMGLVGLVGFCYMVSVESGFRLVAQDFYTTFASYSLTVIPMFIFMGSVAFHSGMSGRLFDTAYKFWGQVRGGLAISAVIACAGFAAICGSTNASAAAMGRVTLPEMKRHNYDPSLATGCVAAGGTLGILIPPSTIFIIYGILTQQSIGRLFAAGIFPGLILTALLALTIYIQCRLNPALGPSGARVIWKERIVSLLGVSEMVALFGLVMGGLFVGFFTPTEAGAVGAAGALGIGLGRRRLTWRAFVDSLAETTRITSMLLLILAGATLFGHFLAVTKVPFGLASWIGSLSMPPSIIMGGIILGYLIAGCFIDVLALIILTVPILFPLVVGLGFDPIWFGVIIVLVTGMGVITPPVGVNVYVIRGVARDIPLEVIFRGIFPFLGAMIVNAVLLIFFPQIALFLPNLISF